MKTTLQQKSENYLKTLCTDIPERSVGSAGNRAATCFFKQTVAELGWDTTAVGFSALDWSDGGAVLQCNGQDFSVFAAPYSRGCDVREQLVSASTIHELEKIPGSGRILLLRDELTREQLMPKNFVFYNPAEHKRIIALLEEIAPAAIIAATGKNAALAGGLYPFPLIEDGDFNIPSVYMTAEEGARLADCIGKQVLLRSDSQRIPGKGYNVTAGKGSAKTGRIVITAHIDAKKGTPGALDNAAGVVVLLLLAEMLQDHTGPRMVELVAFNGEDYYSVPGQMLYLAQNRGRFHEIALNINIDGAGYKTGPTAWSLFGLPAEWENKTRQVFKNFIDIVEGEHWVQGDHSIFIQNKCPAIAVTSKWFLDHIDRQEITHTPKDNMDIIDTAKLAAAAQAIAALLEMDQVEYEF